jgi:hypothetical protein
LAAASNAATLVAVACAGAEKRAEWAISDGEGYMSNDIGSRFLEARSAPSNEKPENSDSNAPDLSEDMKRYPLGFGWAAHECDLDSEAVFRS